MNDVQEILMQLRKKGWTLVAIGRELNISPSTVQKWSGGRRYPASPSTVKASLSALGQSKADRKVNKVKRKPVYQLSPEVRAGMGMFKDLAPGRSLADELIQERREEAARE